MCTNPGTHLCFHADTEEVLMTSFLADGVETLAAVETAQEVGGFRALLWKRKSG